MSILITGRPGVGKTTLVLRVMDMLQRKYPELPVRGFVTREVRGSNGRVGFDIINLETKAVVPLARLAALGGPPSPTVGRYGVYVREFEQVAVPILDELLRQGPGQQPSLVVVDEIGKMELFSTAFVAAMRRLLTTGNVMVLATVAEKGPGFIGEAKGLPGLSLVTVTAQNREALPLEVATVIESRLRPVLCTPDPQTDHGRQPQPAPSPPAPGGGVCSNCGQPLQEPPGPQGQPPGHQGQPPGPPGQPPGHQGQPPGPQGRARGI